VIDRESAARGRPSQNRASTPFTDVLGGVAAHYCYDHTTVHGFIFPTLRRVVRRTAEGPLLSGRSSFILDYTDLLVRD
jgi:hypothetical protein